MLERNARRLVEALESYYQQHNSSYTPVDTPTMQQSVEAVKTLLANRDTSVEARLNRVLGTTDELEQPLQALTNLATALKDYDDSVHDALLYIDGTII